MNRRFFVCATLLAVLGFTAAIPLPQDNPDAVLGVWLTGSGKGRVKVYKQGEQYFGQLVWLKEPLDPATGKPKLDKNNPDDNLKAKPLLGLVNLRDFTYIKPSVWEEGKIYDPENGNDYRCEMKLTDPNTLEVRGFIGVSLFGRTDVWKRQVKKQ